MKIPLTILCLLLALSTRAQTFITATVTVTNTAGTVNGNTITVNGTQRLFTNNVVNFNNQITSFTNIQGAASNLFLAYAIKRENGMDISTSSTNAMILSGFPGFPLTVSLGGSWGTVSLSTQSLGGTTVVRVPMSSVGSVERTNVESGMVDYLNDNKGTNTVAGNAPFFANFASKTNANNFTAANTFSNLANYFAGDGGGLTNVHAIGASNGLFTVSGDTNTAVFIVLTSPGAGGSTNVIAGNPSGIGIGAIFITPSGINGTAGPGLTALDTTNLVGVVQQANFGAGLIATNFTTIGTNVLNGILSYPRTNDSSLANGPNYAVPTGNACYIRLSGPSGSFTVYGFSGGVDGRIIFIQNSSGQALALANNSGDPTAANRIFTGTGADIAAVTTATLIYDTTDSLWHVFSVH